MDVPETRYVRSGDLQIAYQVVGEGPLDIVLIPAYLSNIELFWELPTFSRFFGRLSSFARLIRELAEAAIEGRVILKPEQRSVDRPPGS